MSSNSPNEFISKKEDQELEEEDKIISKYILALKNDETRDEAMKNLHSYNKNPSEKIGLYLWYSGGTMAVLLQELIKLYQYLPPYNSKKITNESYNKAIQIAFFFECVALNSQTKKELIESGILVYIFPFLSIIPNSRNSLMIRTLTLRMLHTLIDKKLDIETFNILKQHQIMITLLKIVSNGKELDKKIACHIMKIIISNDMGLEYFCEVKQRLQALVFTFAQILVYDDCVKLKKFALRILLKITENNEAKNEIKDYLLDLFKKFNIYQNLDESGKIKAKQLEKILQDGDMGLETGNSESKIQKLKSDLTNNSNNNTNNGNNNSFKTKKNEVNNLHNLNLTKSNSFTGYNNNANQRQININSNEFNNNGNKLNINMMFINNMNQIKMTNGYMMPPVGDINYNLNKDNEGYMNPNMYNQNGNNGFGNMNFYNTFKNM
jgi:CCR4-NOT transcription complex subunit 9